MEVVAADAQKQHIRKLRDERARHSLRSAQRGHLQSKQQPRLLYQPRSADGRLITELSPKLHGEKDVKVQDDCLRSYTQAISALRADLLGADQSSLNDALVAAALLFCCETTLNPKAATVSPHTNGLSAIILSQAKRSTEPSELARGIIYFHWKGTFAVPVALGEPSPFDNQYWLSLEPVSHWDADKEVLRLRHLGQKLFIRLPRLIASVRALRVGSPPSTAIDTAIQLAKDLVALEDVYAENKVLHRISMVKTSDTAAASIVPFSFQYQDTTTFEAAVYYWQTRIILNRLCIKLPDLRPPGNTDFDTATLKTENVRMAINIIMSWQYGCAIGVVGGWALCLAFVAVWGAAYDVPELQRGGRPLSLSKVRPWLAEHYDRMHGGTADINEATMDEAAEVLVGGPLTGFTVTGFKQ
ncbi:hypothetical protein LTR37_011839 [Vermiconidia calcicola]|uniref:Uncharacterized protein n=1 Tax=Vermiconidia calcicola TaxID=1690605 RepID=A0ACC3N146_9PEZI|nr:hypothetical protein LTR37_011839 [Vermiconidia calcicola]